jgi:hypothetical protein
MDNIYPILLEQGILGTILVISMLWIRSQNLQAKKERESLQDKLFALIEQTNKFDAHTGHQLTEVREEVRRLVDRIEGRRA